MVDLHTQLAAAEASLAELRHASDASKLLERANRELDQLRGRLRVSAQCSLVSFFGSSAWSRVLVLQTVEAEVRDRERDLREQESATRQAREERDRTGREKEAREREMKSDMRKLMKEIQRLQKRLKMKEGLSLPLNHLSPYCLPTHDRFS